MHVFQCVRGFARGGELSLGGDPRVPPLLYQTLVGVGKMQIIGMALQNRKCYLSLEFLSVHTRRTVHYLRYIRSLQLLDF